MRLDFCPYGLVLDAVNLTCSIFQGAKSIAEMLKKNSSLRVLELNNNMIDYSVRCLCFVMIYKFSASFMFKRHVNIPYFLNLPILGIRDLQV